MSAQKLSVRDALYEVPGPKMRRRIIVGTIIALALIIAGFALIINQFYIKGQLDATYWEFFTWGTTWKFLFEGFIGTMEVALTAGVMALVLGLVFMLGRVSPNKVISTICRILIDFFRGVPSLLLIYFFFLVVPTYGVKLPAFWMITLPVGFAASGVLAEVFRAGVNAVPHGQVEAAMALGMTRRKIMWKIILPQAIHFIIPSLISQLVVVVKDTALAYVVSYPDMLQNARVLITSHNALVSTYLVIAVIYILLNYLINRLAVYVSKKTGVKIISRTEGGSGPA